MSTADKLNALVQTKADIKQALIDKGQNPTDVFSTYADDIRAIETGGGSGGVFDFASIGYTGNEEPFKSGIEYAKQIKANYDNGIIPQGFMNDENLYFFPKIDFGDKKNLSSYFKGSNLIMFPSINFNGELLNLYSTFNGCKKLIYVEQLDYTKINNIDYCFQDCNNLQNVGIIDCTNIAQLRGVLYDTAINYNPFINTHNVRTMGGLFYGCVKLNNPDLSSLNTSNVTEMSNMFRGCSNLVDLNISNFDVSKVTTMALMFSDCSSLKNITLPDNFGAESKNMNNMFKNCRAMTIIPQLNTEKVTDMQGFADECINIRRIEGISAKSLTKMDYSAIFGFADCPNLRYFLCKDIGTQSTVTSVQFTYYKLSNWGVNNSEVEDAKQSLTDSLITYSFDRATAGYSTCTITLSTNTKALLTEEEIAQITAKGFTIA